jgi:hypothetical protein
MAMNHTVQSISLNFAICITLFFLFCLLTRHYLQPLDVACFGPLERVYCAEVEAHGRFDGTYVEKSDFVTFYERAKAVGQRSANINSGFRATGLVPYNPQVIYDKIAKQSARPVTPPSQLATNADLQDVNTIRKIQYLVESIHDTSVRQYLLDRIERIYAENAILSKANADLVANARSKRPRKKKQLHTEARYLSKETAETLKAEITQKEAEKEARKATILRNKATRAAKQAEAKRATALRQLARAANTESVDKAQKQRLPPVKRPRPFSV